MKKVLFFKSDVKGYERKGPGGTVHVNPHRDKRTKRADTSAAERDWGYGGSGSDADGPHLHQNRDKQSKIPASKDQLARNKIHARETADRAGWEDEVIRHLEAAGMTHSDAQGVLDASSSRADRHFAGGVSPSAAAKVILDEEGELDEIHGPDHPRPGHNRNDGDEHGNG